MSLITILNSDPNFASSKTIQQLAAVAGDGEIRDGGPALQELRAFLRLVQPESLFDYAHQCLDKTGCGYLLQEVVNELGRRLGFDVENGLLHGKRGAIGFDGIWRASIEPEIVVEIKTTDAYAIYIEIPNKYREDLVAQRKISESSSVLIVVGRENKGDLEALEAQVRGSEFSRSTRLISVDGLIKLIKINNDADNPDTTTKQIRKLLHPVEYIQLDNLIDLVFTTIAGREETAVTELAADSVGGPRVDRTLIDDKRQQAITAFSALKDRELIQRSRTFYWTEDKKLRVCCTVSKRYENAVQPYFYAYHPKWDDFLKGGDGFLILCCLDRDDAFAVPQTWFDNNKQSLHLAQHGEGINWLIFLTQLADGSLGILLKDGKTYNLHPHAFGLQDGKSRMAAK